jgi:hypothetical protein
MFKDKGPEPVYGIGTFWITGFKIRSTYSQIHNTACLWPGLRRLSVVIFLDLTVYKRYLALQYDTAVHMFYLWSRNRSGDCPASRLSLKRQRAAPDTAAMELDGSSLSLGADDGADSDDDGQWEAGEELWGELPDLTAALERSLTPEPGSWRIQRGAASHRRRQGKITQVGKFRVCADKEKYRISTQVFHRRSFIVLSSFQDSKVVCLE